MAGSRIIMRVAEGGVPSLYSVGVCLWLEDDCKRLAASTAACCKLATGIDWLWLAGRAVRKRGGRPSAFGLDVQAAVRFHESWQLFLFFIPFRDHAVQLMLLRDLKH
jgi:hypothetical protein